MAWRDGLRPASFRGVPFKVESHDAQGGRRGVKHEFPLRDKPYVEDMGRRGKDFSIEAYVVGDDYFNQRDALMRACDAAGSADLVHPYLGTLKVLCVGWTLRESKSEGRMARFALTFMETGEAIFPSDSTDTVAKANTTADAAKAASIADFAKRFSISGLPDFGVNDAKALLTGATGQMTSIARSITTLQTGAGFFGQVTNFVGSLSSLMGAPSQLGSELFGLVGSLAGLFGNSRSAVSGLSGMNSFGSELQPINVTTSTRQRQQDNRDAITGLVQQAAVIEAARIAPSATYETTDDAEAVRTDLTDQLDSIMEEPTTTDDVFSSLQDMRTAVVRGVPPENVALPNLVTLTPAATLPSVVLAYETYEDANRDEEIVSRNNIKYPGFVPGAEPLKVLSDA